MPSVTDDMLRLYADSDAVALGALVRAGEISPLELVETGIAAIEKVNPRLNAVIHRLYDMGRAQAASLPTTGVFAGVPFLLKEIATPWEGAPLTNCIPWMKDLKAASDSDAVRRMKAAGLVLVGKSNAPEGGWAITTEPTLYGVTHNPWREDVTSGGSSGGAASAVASRMVPIAEASDGAGSIRVPASCCGVVGLKPSRGRITFGPDAVDVWYGGVYYLAETRTVRDTAAYLDALAGALPGDPYAPPTPAEPWFDLAKRAPSRLRVAFSVTPPDGSPIDAEAVHAVRDTVRTLESLGHSVEEHDMRFDTQALWKTYCRMIAVTTANMYVQLEPVVGRPVTEADLAPLNWAMLQVGRSVSGAQHAADIEAIRLASRRIVTDLLPYDVFVTPTLTQKPRPLGYWNMNDPDYDHYNATWTDPVFMYPFNVSGQPAISLPLHWSADGLPMGVQLVGRYGDEATLLATATVLEQAMPWRDRRPAICV